MYSIKFQAMIRESMKSSEEKMAYEERLLREYDEQKQAMERRIAENKKHEEAVIPKIIEKVKNEMFKEEDKAEAKGYLYAPAEPNYLIAVQIRSQCGINPKTKKTMELLRLTKINRCVILKNNECIRKMLQISKDYIAYGTVDYQMLRKLVYNRGCGKIGNSRVKLTNEVIEDAFDGKYRCIEELLYSVYSGSEDMKMILNFIVPIKLNCPRGGFCAGRKLRSFVQGGASGNHEELLCNLLEKMI
ncbi:RL7 [Enterospora canceri]|uniref:RL7 n=1 Tax=Enterospora canceri TaxID=1081671 RepID=A0A1Y1S7Q2_9MICR|nr:RL7 [Enterospora canceri]